ncbi:MAG: GNAT family N-acetyltransferase [Bacteroidetes bacterium]|nr:GNAT family N-acetyltransferase [Bacteroidota bacterium]
MNQDKDYLFKSQRLGFRNWESADIDELHKINSDKKVMEFFPSVSTKKQTIEFIEKMKSQFSEKGFCYYAVDKLENNNFIGFIGLSEQNFIADFTPCVDIGWRIKYSEWNKGFATEGAIKCLQYAFEVLKIEEIFSIAPKINLKSTHIMAKIGLKKQNEFEHPLLKNDARLKTCVLFKIEK